MEGGGGGRVRGGRDFIVAVTIVKRSIERHLRVQDMHVMVCVSACDWGRRDGGGRGGAGEGRESFYSSSYYS